MHWICGCLGSLHLGKMALHNCTWHQPQPHRNTPALSALHAERQQLPGARQQRLTLLALASHSFLVTLMPLLLRWPVASDADSAALLGKPAIALPPSVACLDAVAAAAATPLAAVPCVCAASTPAVSLLLGLLLLLLAALLLPAAWPCSAAAASSPAPSWLPLLLVVLKLPMLWQPTEFTSSSATGAACCAAALAETADLVATAAAVAADWLAEGIMLERTPCTSNSSGSNTTHKQAYLHGCWCQQQPALPKPDGHIQGCS
jgi:hypothetical protein